jgi:hypothetical protein
LKQGKIAKLPNYKGYFRWDYANNRMYFINGTYTKNDLDEEKKRTDWYYII